MAEEINLQTQMSLIRTRFSAERTLMSWIRTSFSMITFGFALLKFFQYLHSANPAAPPATGAHNLGIFLILLGIFCLFPGLIEHYKTLNVLHVTDGSSRWSYAFVVAILVGVLGAYALANAIFIRLF